MTSATEGLGRPLAREQRSIVELPVSAKTLVVAPAGTGKTTVLVDRLRFLVAEQQLDPGQEILVLSFTRSAVRVMRDRLRLNGGAAAYVRAVTFDSFATRVLAESRPEGSWTTAGFDQRIAAAIRLLDDDAEARRMLSDYRHILVDEIQDLVGIRDELVRTVLQLSGGGFTLFGDPAQAIYNFELARPDRAKGSSSLFTWLEATFGSGLRICELSRNYRASSAQTQALLPYGAKLRDPSADHRRIREDLRTAMMSAPRFAPLCAAAAAVDRAPGRTAILCRTNAEALTLSDRLFACGVRHTLRRAATDRVLPGWVAAALDGIHTTSIGKQAFMARIRSAPDIADAETPPAEDAWRLLKRVEHRPDHNTLDLTRLVFNLGRGVAPDDLYDARALPIEVSTIHRAKGLEFERVVVVDYRDSLDEDDIICAEEARLLYVATTRAKAELFSLEGLETFGLTSKSNPGERWIKRIQGWKVLEFEVRGTDVYRMSPTGVFIVQTDVRATQDYMRRQVRTGDPLSMALEREVAEGGHTAYYSLRHGSDSTVVGVTGEDFARDLSRTLSRRRGWKVNWPKALVGLRVDGLETAVGSPATGQRAGLGHSGTWLSVRPVGLATLKFS